MGTNQEVSRKLQCTKRAAMKIALALFSKSGSIEHHKGTGDSYIKCNLCNHVNKNHFAHLT